MTINKKYPQYPLSNKCLSRCQATRTTPKKSPARNVTLTPKKAEVKSITNLTFGKPAAGASSPGSGAFSSFSSAGTTAFTSVVKTTASSSTSVARVNYTKQCWQPYILLSL